MNRRAYGLALTLLLTLLAGFGGAMLGARVIEGQDRTRSLHAIAHEGLDLSAEQHAQINTLEEQFARHREAREAELRAANSELAHAIRSRHEYSAEVQAAIERFHHAMGELQKETVMHVLAMRSVLTSDQAEKFDKRIAEALTEEAP